MMIFFFPLLLPRVMIFLWLFSRSSQKDYITRLLYIKKSRILEVKLLCSTSPNSKVGAAQSTPWITRGKHLPPLNYQEAQAQWFQWLLERCSEIRCLKNSKQIYITLSHVPAPKLECICYPSEEKYHFLLCTNHLRRLWRPHQQR